MGLHRSRRRPAHLTNLHAHRSRIGLAAVALGLCVLAVPTLAARLMARVQPAQPAVAAAPATPRVQDDPTQAPPAQVLAPSGPCLSIPILYYHYIRVNPVRADINGFKLSVTPDNFRKQMALLQSEGAHTLTMADVMAALEGREKLPSNPVVLTFDDGHDDFATRAAPIMQEYGIRGTAYVVPGFFGLPSYMTAAQVEEVAARGFVIGAHTLHHVNLTSRTPEVARLEIEGSREQLQAVTHQPVLDFAYPYGRVNVAVEQLVEDAGFREAAGTGYGYSQCLGGRFDLRRIEVTGWADLHAFAKVAQLPYLPPATGVPGAPPIPSAAATSPSPSASATPHRGASPSPSSRPSAAPTPQPSPRG